ncbi:MAG: 1-acyl-sn-glycerol-3-phosphate acyltransferase [Alphaproteobacteria bacterium]|nr:1-acyl-sn-glycerol-3-phosphate acyltransferase [Alphaproteobacteria bacterium]
MPTGLTGRILAIVRTFLFVIWAPLGAGACFVLSVCGADSAWMRVILFRGLCQIFGIDVVVHGEPVASRPLLIASNHVSYLDIIAFGSVAELEFVSKAEVATWPVIGWLAKLGDTVFIERLRTRTLEARKDMAARLGENRTLVFFPEATAGDGNRLLPFKSALFTVTSAIEGVTVQPAAIAYTRLNGLPTGFGWRAFFAWYGNMTLFSHAWRFLHLGRTTVEIAFLPPVDTAGEMDRKALATATENAVRVGFNHLLSGQSPHQ